MKETFDYSRRPKHRGITGKCGHAWLNYKELDYLVGSTFIKEKYSGLPTITNQKKIIIKKFKT